MKKSSVKFAILAVAILSWNSQLFAQHVSPKPPQGGHGFPGGPGGNVHPSQPSHPTQPPVNPGNNHPTQPPVHPGNNHPTQPPAGPGHHTPPPFNPGHHDGPGQPPSSGYGYMPHPPQDYGHHGDPVTHIHNDAHNVVMPRPGFHYDNTPFHGQYHVRPPHDSLFIGLTIGSVYINSYVTNPGYSSYWFYAGNTHVYHHYDNSYHWYGFWYNDAMFWTRYYENRFWWFDPAWHRWVYFNDGAWWWQDPYNVTVIYVYRDGYYYRYGTNAGSVVVTPVYTPAPYTPPADYQPLPVEPVTPVDETPLQNDTYYYSTDGSRSVEVSGDRDMALLYDLTADDTDGQPKFLSFLGVGVTEVLYQYGADGAVTNILVIWKDQAGAKQFSMFDANGAALSGQPSPQQGNADPAQPVAPRSSVGQLEGLVGGKAFR